MNGRGATLTIQVAHPVNTFAERTRIFMALKAAPPKDDTDRERARYAHDLADMKANPSAWANGPEHVPTNVVQETITVRQIERPAGAMPVAPTPPEPPAVSARPLPPAPGVTLDEGGRIVPV